MPESHFFHLLLFLIDLFHCSGCPAGRVALMDGSNNNRLISCDDDGMTTSACASGYQCTYSPLLDRHICCGTTVPPDTCPAGQHPYIDQFLMTPRQCQPNVEHSCPSGFFCWYTVAQNSYYCCGSAPGTLSSSSYNTIN